MKLEIDTLCLSISYYFTCLTKSDLWVLIYYYKTDNLIIINYDNKYSAIIEISSKC